MQLSGFTDLALRLVMRLAVQDSTTTTRAVSEELEIRYTHAAKAVAALQRLGVVETRRGRAGGLSLREEARSFSVGRLVRDLERPAEVVQCEGPTPCPLRGGCRLRTALRDAQEAFFAALDPLTIADLTAPPTRTLLLTLGTRPST
ncbi:Rrf2 family transcriptional regulator [Nocardioides panaciterrulae]|uniref:Rrf2 family nitric oxide-sensitive transcriptional repressor n=1 Tax=Nocardioides panaciterrulae TaxID=661492 RepID=A0A7Y9J9I3_9ACTN|nr:Rrf2 family nitric oxide-sensitive transcriptional repressor [Nocardioides panaciterrulae]